MKRGFNTVEEEFLRYGNSDRDSFKNEEYPKSKGGGGNILSKTISVLVIMVLAILLVILAKVGYMFLFNPTDIEKVVRQ
jgi:flagellar basal body-associated protein FliL